MYDADVWNALYEAEADAGGLVERVLGGLFEQERLAIGDDARVKAYQCTRRAGKTHVQAADAYICSEENPGGESMCVATTVGHVSNTVGNALQRLQRKYDLPLREKTKKGLLYWHNTRTDHKIWLRGCKDFNEAEKLRGDFLHGCWIDEAQSFPLAIHPANQKVLLQYVVEDVISPRLLDTDGKLVLSGTPGPLLQGYFWEVTTGDGTREGAPPKWSTHHWSMLDNPHLKDTARWIETRKRLFGWKETSPAYQREILGRWVYDPDSLIYRYDAQRNHYDGGRWPECLDNAIRDFGPDLYWVLGSDIGDQDATTFVLTVSAPGHPRIVYLRAWGGSEMTNPQRAAEFMRVVSELKKRGQRLSRTVMDPGGGGKATGRDMWEVYGVPIEMAQKVDKAAGIRLLQGDIMAGRALVNAVACQPLLAEWTVLPWKADRSNHAPNYPDDYSDAAVYARREHPIIERWDHVPPTPGTPAALNAEALEDKKMAAREAEILYSGMRPSRVRRELKALGVRRR